MRQEKKGEEGKGEGREERMKKGRMGRRGAGEEMEGGGEEKREWRVMRTTSRQGMEGYTGSRWRMLVKWKIRR